MGRALRNERGHGPAGPFDDLAIFIVLLVVVFGYTPLEALGITGRIIYWAFVLVIAPVCLLFVVYLAYDSEPIGGDHDRWWRRFADQVHDRTGVERLNSVSLTEAGAHGTGHRHDDPRAHRHGGTPGGGHSRASGGHGHRHRSRR